MAVISSRKRRRLRVFRHGGRLCGVDGRGQERLQGQDLGRPRVRRPPDVDDLRRAGAQPGRALHRRTGQMREMLTPGVLFAYGIFYPEGAPRSRPSTSSSSAAPRRVRLREPDWWVQQIQELADFYIAPSSATAPSTTATTARTSTLDGKKRATRQETDTISRLVYGFASAYLLTGEDGSSKRPRRAPSTCATTCAPSTRPTTSSTGTTASTSEGRHASTRSSPPSSATTTTRSRPTSRSTPWPARPRPTASPATRGSSRTSR